MSSMDGFDKVTRITISSGQGLLDMLTPWIVAENMNDDAPLPTGYNVAIKFDSVTFYDKDDKCIDNDVIGSSITPTLLSLEPQYGDTWNGMLGDFIITIEFFGMKFRGDYNMRKKTGELWLFTS